MSTAPGSPQTASKTEWSERWLEARCATDALFDLLRPEAFYTRPIPERHRLIFYLGHLEAFDWNLLAPRVPQASAFRPEWDKLFAFGIDPVGGGLPTDQPSDWPAVEAVRDYVREVRTRLEPAFDGNDVDARHEQLLHVALEHRWMHAETLAYLLHALPYPQKHAGPAPRPRVATVAPGSAEVQVAAGAITLGRAPGAGFGWDNEFAAQRVAVDAFSAGRCKVTNGEFLEFIRDGGYGAPAHWDEAAWEWRKGNGIEHPRFWAGGGGEWRFRGMFGEVALPLDWPVWVSHAEASAFARWSGRALPSEAQWQRLACGDSGGERSWPWGEADAAAQGNFNLRGWDPEAGTAHPEGASAWGGLDLIGNGWEWTATPFAPFPGFERFDFYPGYSADFFDGRHFVLKGGSPRTHASLLRTSFRNWFQPHYQYLYAGFRCVRPA